MNVGRLPIRHIAFVLTLVIAGALFWRSATVRGDEKSDAQLLTDAPKPAQLTDSAKAVLADVDKAYSSVAGLKLAGTLSFDADVSGQKASEHQDFTATFTSPNLFRHEAVGQVLAGSTGDKVYVFLPRRNIYVKNDALKEKPTDNALPGSLRTILSSQNPSLLMAITKSPTEALTSTYEKVDQAPDVKLDGVSYTALKMTNESEVATVLIDPKTHFIRRATSDLRPLMEKRGADAVKKAEFVIDYTTLEPVASATPADQFAWTPPEGSRDVTNNLQELLTGGGAGAAEALVGKPVPDFTLPTLDGQTVKVSTLKGKPLILDFWTTWCGPCMMSLPELDAFDRKNKDKVKIVAVNVGEDKTQVSGVVQQKGWGLTVALDEDEKVAGTYGIDGFPTTVFVDSKGIVRKVTAGMSSQDELAKIIGSLSQ